jgi:hypothetical protein
MCKTIKFNRKADKFPRNPIREYPLSEFEESEHLSENQWVFFAPNAKLTSMRRALAERLAESETVVIVGQPVSLLRDSKLLTFEKRCQGLCGVYGSWHYQPLHFPERVPGLRKILTQLNQYFLRRELNSLLRKNGKRIVCYDSPTQDQLVGNLGEDLSIYVAIDDRTITVQGDRIRGELEAEKRLLSRVDKVVCVSKRLAEVLRLRVPSGRNLPISVLPNGYDERIFNPGKNYFEPSDLVNVPNPRILVAGHISERTDWNGIHEASRIRPDWTWVFVGSPDTGIQERIFHDLGPQGFWHPPVPLEEVPAWIQNCDACAVPYRLNNFTLASSPLKAIEYLAMGVPVLSTRIPALQSYGDVIHWVNEGCGESYAQGLDKALAEKTDPGRTNARRLTVTNDSWARKAEKFKAMMLSA